MSWWNRILSLAQLPRAGRGPLRRRSRRPLSLEGLEPRRPLAADLAITEVHYQPLPQPGGQFPLSSSYEFIEIQNIGTASRSLNGVRIRQAANFTFGNTTLAPGAMVVVASNVQAFQQRYSLSTPVVGPYTGTLSDGGELVELREADDSLIQSFTYQDYWYPAVSGGGHSLVVRQTSSPPAALNQADGWRPSSRLGGSPGASDTGLYPGAVVINEIDAHTDSVFGDRIELRNTSLAPVAIGGWYLSDSASNLQKYRIATGTVLQPGATIVFAQNLHFGTIPNPAAGFGLSELGDSLYLTAPLGPSGENYGVSVTFGATPQNITWGRHRRSDGTHTLTLLSMPTLGAPNAPPLVGPIAVTELMYNPGVNENEFIELFNASAAPVPLFDPARPANTWRFTQGIAFQFPQGVTIPAGGRLLLVDDDVAQFRTEHSVPASVQIFSYDASGESFSNGGEAVELSRPGEPEPPNAPMPGFVPYYRVDFFEYQEDFPWPTQPDGNGPSLVRRAPLLFGDDVGSWTTGVAGGSPGTGDPDLTSPRVLDVRVSGSTWTLPALSVPVGSAAQLVALPWSDIDRITIAFSEAVTVDNAALDVDGANGVFVATPNVAPGVAATEVTWTLSAPIGTDAILLDLENQRLHDVAGNPLDGEWTEASSTYPSGNGASGGDFRFSFRVLPGDINQDGVVDALDRRIVRERQFTSSTHAEYLAAADADRNGHINIVDLVRVRNQTGQSAPALSPPAAAPLAAIAESSRVPLALPALSNLKSPILHARPRAVDQLLADSDVVSRELTARRRR